MANKLSVVILTKDEEKDIRSCLESVKWADEIIIVDDMSMDGTLGICREYTGKIFTRKLDGFGSQKQFGIDKASGTWVLVLDADEVLSDELQKDIRNIIQADPQFNGYEIWRKTFYQGRWIRHCGWYSPVMRLFRNGKGRFDMKYVHESILVEGPTADIRSPILHYSYKNISQHINKVCSYSSLDAMGLYEKGVRIRFYNCLWYWFCKPVLAFFRKYILMAGILDGAEGFIISVFTAFVVFVNYAKVWEIQKRHEKIDNNDDRVLLERFYRTADQYSRRLELHDDGAFKEYEEFISRYAKTGSRILDIGCGSGSSSKLLCKEGCTVVGLDLSEMNMVSAANKAGGGAGFVQANALKLPFKDASFDIVGSFLFIEHMYEVETCLAEMGRVVKEGGVVAILSPNLLSPINQLYDLFYIIFKKKNATTFGDSNIRTVLQRLVYNIVTLFSKICSGSIRFIYRKPVLENRFDFVPDNDAVYLSNPVDLKRWFKRHGFTIVKFQGETIFGRILPSFVTGIHIAARKRRSKI